MLPPLLFSLAHPRTCSPFFVALLLLAGCTGTRNAGDTGPTEPRYERLVTPFEVIGPNGESYAHPFLGGLDVPRPQFVDVDADGDPDLFLQERTDELMFFENTGSADTPRFVWRADRYRDLAVGEWYRFADLDEDGDVDLLAEQPYSYIRYYRNTGTPQEPTFVLAQDTLRAASGEPLFSDRQNIPNVNDIDCDGQMDLFVGRLDGTLTRYEETADEAAVPRFRLVTERFENIEIVSQVAQPGAPMPNVPSRRNPGNGPAAPAEEWMTGGMKEGSGSVLPNYGHPRPHAPTPPRREAQQHAAKHGANTMTFADVDGDGDDDLLWGDYFEPSLLLLENTGSCSNPAFSNDPVPFPPDDPVETSGYNAPAVADVDGDGDADLFVGVIGGAFDPNRTAESNFYYYEHTGVGSYALRTRRFLDGIDVGSESHPAVGDLDGDGDLDLLVGDKVGGADTDAARVLLFENAGGPGRPRLVVADTLGLTPSFNYAPALGDLDGDGRLDLLVGTWNDGVAYYRNTGGDPAFALVDEAFVELTRGSHSSPALGDLDGDGDLDLLVGESSGTLNYYRNEGTPSAPAFELVSDEYLGADVGRRSVPALHDLDGDGDLDLVVGSEQNDLLVYRNVGTTARPSFERDGSLALDAPPLATPTFADFDGDGDADVLSGGQAGGLFYFERQSE